jgi:N-acetylmuramic acid 6-phosphate etherase
MDDQIEIPVTERDNPRTAAIGSLPTADIVRLMNEEDQLVADAVQQILDSIATAVDRIVERLTNGGRLFYIGTGTSGRLGVLDASECPPTFGVSPELVQGIIAGGHEACYRAVEASEDDREQGRLDLAARSFGPKDVVVGVAASGRTPYTVGAVEYARSIGAATVALTCVPNSPLTSVADIPLVVEVGPEVITGSTRLKSGTAQKLVLNMLSTATMIRLGYVTGNRMTNLLPRNQKLQQRAVRILIEEVGVDEGSAISLLDLAKGDLRVAIVIARTGKDAQVAQKALEDSDGVISRAIGLLS